MSLRRVPVTIAQLTTRNRPLIAQTFRSFPTSRSFATTMAMKGALSDQIIQDHREIEEYYNAIIQAEDEDTQTRYQNLFTWELARHSIGEELVVYPLFEKHLGAEGKQMADKDREEHAEVKLMLKNFQNLKAGDPDFKPALKELYENLAQHIKEEEENDLPALEAKLGPTDSVAVAKSFDRTKKFAPTRSHPSAPDKPPFETVAGLMAAPMDKLADMFRRFP